MGSPRPAGARRGAALPDLPPEVIVADASDRKWDSGVFIERIQSNAVTMTTGNAAGLPDLVEGLIPAGCDSHDRRSRRPARCPVLHRWYRDQRHRLPLIGTGPDPMVPKVATIPANQAFVDVPLEPIDGRHRGRHRDDPGLPGQSAVSRIRVGQPGGPGT